MAKGWEYDLETHLAEERSKAGQGQRGQDDVQGQQTLSALGRGGFQTQPERGSVHGSNARAGDN